MLLWNSGDGLFFDFDEGTGVLRATLGIALSGMLGDGAFDGGRGVLAVTVRDGADHKLFRARLSAEEEWLD